MEILGGILGLALGFGMLALTLAAAIASIIVLIDAFKKSVADGLLCLFVPFYLFYYLFANFSHKQKSLIVALALAGPVVVCGVGVLSALAMFGTRRYLGEAKKAEARVTLGRIAKDMGRYVETDSLRGRPTELPASAPPVPASRSAVSGKKYRSSPDEWSGSWSLIKFSMNDPQYFQYEWERLSPSRGVARASADFDGDGKVDARFELPVDCTRTSDGLDCRIGPNVTELK